MESKTMERARPLLEDGKWRELCEWAKNDDA